MIEYRLKVLAKVINLAEEWYNRYWNSFQFFN